MSASSTVQSAARSIDENLKVAYMTDAEIFACGITCERFIILVNETFDLLYEIFPDEMDFLGDVPKPPEWCDTLTGWLEEIRQFLVDSAEFHLELGKLIPVEEEGDVFSDEALWDLINQA